MDCDRTYDVAIIGSGIGGLVCGCYLAQEGLNVILLEKHSAPGGYCTSFSRNGFLFDSAVHYIGSMGKGILKKILEEIDFDMPFNTVNCSYRVILPRHQLDGMTDLEGFIEELQRAFPHESLNISRFFYYICKEKISTVFPKVKNRTFKEVMDGILKDEDAKGAVNLFLANIGIPSSKAAAISAIILFREYVLDDMKYPDGGMQSFADGLAQQFKEFGGEICLSKNVSEIVIRDNMATGVRLESGEIVKAAKIVSNADATLTFLNLLKTATKESLCVSRMQASPASFMVYLGLRSRGPFHFKSVGSVAVSGTYDMDAQFEACEQSVKEGDIPFCVISSPSAHKRNLANDKHTLQIMAFAPFASIDFWKCYKEGFSEALITLAESVIGPFRHLIEYKDAASPLTFKRYTNNHLGASYGWGQTLDQIDPRLVNHRTSLKNLFMTGHWSTGGIAQSGIPGVAISGRRAAEVIIKDFQKAWRYPFINL